MIPSRIPVMIEKILQNTRNLNARDILFCLILWCNINIKTVIKRKVIRTIVSLGPLGKKEILSPPQGRNKENTCRYTRVFVIL